MDSSIQESLSLYRDYTKTQDIRHNFYCYCSNLYFQELAIVFMLIEDFRKSRRKRQAAFITEWFIDGKVPADLQSFLSEVNLSSKKSKQYRSGAEGAINAVGRTFADKAKNHGGGLKGIFGALKQKSSSTQISGDIFDEMQLDIIAMLNENGGEQFVPDSSYMPNGKFANQIHKFRQALKEASFDPNALGIY